MADSSPMNEQNYEYCSTHSEMNGKRRRRGTRLEQSTSQVLGDRYLFVVVVDCNTYYFSLSEYFHSIEKSAPIFMNCRANQGSTL